MKNEKIFALKKLETKLNFSDLVLPNHTLAEINEVDAAIKIKQQSSLSLFYGPSGSGKTLVASLLAKSNNMVVWRVDASSLGFKYRNEAEQNLSEILTKAQELNVILFFDEAEALFGKRTGVKDSHDKYANIETAKFLEELEASRCFAIFSATTKSSLDDSFLRRLRFTVEFAMPNKQQRLQLWRQNLNASLKPQQEINLEDIANNYELTGGGIQNVIRKIVLQAPLSFTKSELSKLINKELEKRK